MKLPIKEATARDKNVVWQERHQWTLEEVGKLKWSESSREGPELPSRATGHHAYGLFSNLIFWQFLLQSLLSTTVTTYDFQINFYNTVQPRFKESYHILAREEERCLNQITTVVTNSVASTSSKIAGTQLGPIWVCMCVFFSLTLTFWVYVSLKWGQ